MRMQDATLPLGMFRVGTGLFWAGLSRGSPTVLPVLRERLREGRKVRFPENRAPGSPCRPTGQGSRAPDYLQHETADDVKARTQLRSSPRRRGSRSRTKEPARRVLIFAGLGSRLRRNERKVAEQPLSAQTEGKE